MSDYELHEAKSAAERILAEPQSPELSISVLAETEYHGVHLRHLLIPDVSDNDPERESVQEYIDALDDGLKRHPEWQAPIVKNGVLDIENLNPAAAMLFRSESLRKWREDFVPSAMALANLYHWQADRLPDLHNGDGEPFSGFPLDKETKDYFKYGPDAIAIRKRARIFKDVAYKYAHEGAVWTSLACGAGVPVLEALNETSGVTLNCVDRDAEALNFLDVLAYEQHLEKGQDYHTIQADLIRELILRETMVDKLGREGSDLVDLLGIIEYFDDRTATKMLTNSFKLVKPGGALVFGNMLSTRPQLDLNQRGFGWPGLYPRELDNIIDLVQTAGLIDGDNVEVSIPDDGIYAVVSVERARAA